MEDKTNKPCDDIFEGLADLLIDNGRITDEYHRTLSAACTHSATITHETVDAYTIDYGNYEYVIIKTDHKVDSIRRSSIHHEESEDD